MTAASAQVLPEVEAARALAPTASEIFHRHHRPILALIGLVFRIKSAVAIVDRSFNYANLQVSLGNLAFIFHHLSLGPKPSPK